MKNDILKMSYDEIEALEKAATEAAGRYDPKSTDPTKAVRTAAFQTDIREFYRERDGKEFDSDDEALRYFFSDRRWKESNIASPASGRFGGILQEMATAGDMSPDQKRRLSNLQTVYERYPYFWQEGGRGWAEGLTENLIAGILDPINLAPGGAAGVAAARAAKAGLSAPVLRGLGQAAKIDAAANAAASAVSDVATQARDWEIGGTDPYRPERTAIAAVEGGVIGAGLGAVIGTVPAILGARKGAAERAANAPPPPPAGATTQSSTTTSAPPAVQTGATHNQPPVPTLLDRLRVDLREAVDAESDPATAQMPKADSENVRRLTTLDVLVRWPATREAMLAKIATLDGPAQLKQQTAITRFDSLYNRLTAADTLVEAERVLDSDPTIVRALETGEVAPASATGEVAPAPQPPAQAAEAPAPAQAAAEGAPPAAADQAAAPLVGPVVAADSPLGRDLATLDALKAQHEAGKAAAAASQAPQPAPGGQSAPKLVVARRLDDGTMTYGKPGQIHPDLVQEGENYLDVDPEQMGFAVPGGPFLTRQEALDFVITNEPGRVTTKSKYGLEAGDYVEGEAPAATPELSRDDALAALEAIGIDRKVAGARLRQVAGTLKGERGAEAAAKRRQAYAKTVEIAKAEAEINQIRKDAYDVALDVLEADKSNSEYGIDQILDLVAEDMAPEMAAAWQKYADLTGRGGEKPDLDKLFRGQVTELVAGIEGQKAARKTLDAAIAQEADSAARAVLPLGKRKAFIEFITKKLNVDLFDDGIAAGRPVEQQLRHIKATVWSRADSINLREEELPTPDPRRGVQDSAPRVEGEDNALANQVANAPPNALRTGRETLEAPIVDHHVDPVTGEVTERMVSGRTLTDVVDPKTGQTAFRQTGGVQGALQGSNKQGFQGPPIYERNGEIRAGGKSQADLEAEASREMGRAQAEKNAKGQRGALPGEATDAPYKIKLPSFAAAEQRGDLNVEVGVAPVTREIQPDPDRYIKNPELAHAANEQNQEPRSGLALEKRYILADKTKNKDGKEVAIHAAPGDEVWLDPKTGKVYKNHPSGTEPPAARAERPTPSPEAAAVSRALASGDKAQAATLTKQLVAARRKSVGLPSTTDSAAPAAQATATATAPEPAPGSAPTGHWVAIRKRDGGHTRVLSVAQAATTNEFDAGAKMLAGKSPLDQFDIGYAPAGTKSGYDVAFTPREATTPVEPPKARDTTKVAKPATFETIKDHPVKVGDETISLGELHARVAELESKSLADLATARATIDALDAALPHLPDMRMPTTTRVRSMRQVGYVMKYAGPETVGVLKDILARLGGGGDTGPRIRRGEADGYVAASSDPAQLNTLRMHGKEAAADGPALTRFVHELGHWAWSNLIPAADKVAFIRYLKNTYFSDQVGLEAFQARIARGTDKSVAELWANQFEAYVAQRFRGGAYSAFWEKHAGAARHLVQHFVDPQKNFLDQRLVEDFFAKLLPDEVLDRMTDQLAGSKNATTTTGKKLQGVHGRYVSLHQAVEDALGSGDMNALREVMLENAGDDGVRTALFGFAKHSKSRDPSLRSRAKSLSERLDTWRQARFTAEKEGPQGGDLTADGIAVRDKAADDEITVFAGEAQSLLADIVQDFKRAFADVERGAKPGTPEAPVRGAAQRRADNRRTAKRLKAKAAEKDAKVVADAKEELAQRPKAQAKNEKPKSDAPASSPRLATDAELADAIATEPAGSPERRQAAREKVRRNNAKPEPPPGAPSLEAQSTPTAVLLRSLADALDAADPKRISEIYLELAERGLTTPLSVKSSAIKHAIAGEARDHAGITFQDGLTPRGPATLQNMQAMIRAKSPEVEAAARTMLERAWRLLNAQTREGLDDALLFDLSTLHRLMGTEPPAGAVGGFVDLTLSSPLRGQLRKSAIALVEGSASPVAAMHEIAHLAMRTLPDETRAFVLDAFGRADDANKTKVLDNYEGKSVQEQAEEWFAYSFADYLAGRVAKSEVWSNNINSGQFTPELKGRLERLLDEIKEIVAYFVNGLIGNKSMKQVFRQITWYGDLFASERPHQRQLVVPASEADAHSRRILNAMSKARKDAIFNYTGDSYGQSRGDPLKVFHATPLSRERVTADDFRLDPSLKGNQGPGFYVSDDPSGVAYDTQPTYGAWQRMIMDVAAARGLGAEQVKDILDVARIMVDGERKVVDLMSVLEEHRHLRDRSEAPDEVAMAWSEITGETLDDPTEPNPTMGDVRAVWDGMVRDQLDQLSDLRAELAEFGVSTKDSHVAPLYMRSVAPLDLREKAMYRPEDVASPDTQIGRLILEMAGDDVPDVLGIADDLTRVATMDLEPGEDFINGYDLHHYVIRRIGGLALMARGQISPDLDTVNAYLKIGGLINQAARRVGYDSIAATETREHLGQKQEFKSTKYDSYTLFERSQLKHQEARFFDQVDDRLMHAVDANLAGGLGEHMIEAGAPAPVAGAKIMHALDTRGIPGAVGRLVDGILGKKGGASSLATAETLGGLQIRENSSRIRKYVSGWIADKVKPIQGTGHYEQIDEQFAKKVMPIIEALDALPGGGSWRNGLREAKFWGEMPQSRSEIKLMHALRRWNDPSARASLSVDEARVAENIMTELRREWTRLQEAGVVTGKIDDFFPQTWREDAIAAKPDQAIAGFARYFIEESRNVPGLTFITPVEAREKAERLVQKLTDQRGVLIAREAFNNAGGKADSLDYQRMIRLEQDWAKEARDMLEPFLENNLRATLSKYFHTTSSRISFVERFGVRGHAVDDYLNARYAGKEVVKELLSNGRSMYRMAKAVVDGGPEYLRNEVPMISGLGYDTANALTDQIYAIANSNLASRKQAITDLIVASHDEKSPHLLRRAEALAQAIMDNPSGKPTFEQVATPELQFVEGFIDSIEGKGANGPYLAIARRVSSAVKAINNVRLLGFTTLTSLSDPAFILGRSGDLKAFTTALTKAASDPDLRQAMRNIGLGADALVQQHMSYLHGTGPSRFAQAFFRVNGLTSWTSFMREFAGIAGWESIKAAQRRAARNLRPDGTGNLTYRQAKRFLEDLGLHEFVPRPDQPSPMSLDDQSLLAGNETVRRALLRFGNEAVFAPNKNDTPHWVSAVPFADLLWQLKTFPVMAGRHAKYVLRELKGGDDGMLKGGNPWPALYMLTLGVGMAAGAQSVKDLVQHRGGEEWEGPQATLRDRSLSKLAKEVGVDVSLNADSDKAIGWYIQSLVALGAFGAMFDIVYNYAQAADNGAFGAQRFAGALFGPTMSGFFDAFNVAGGGWDALTKESWEPNGKRRNAVRTLVGQIPVAGGSRLLREKVTDAIAGEATK